MPGRRKRDPRKTQPVARRRVKRLVVGASALVCALAFAGVLALQLLPAGRPPGGGPDSETHPHPPALHAGQVVAFRAGDAHYHVEFVVEPTGVVHLFPLDVSAAEPFPVEARPLVLTAEAGRERAAHPVMLRPAGPGDRTTHFLGRLPAGAVADALRVRVTEFWVRGERYRFEFEWASPLAAGEFERAFRRERERIFLTAAGKYREADIRGNGGRVPTALVGAAPPVHDHSPGPGTRTCPVSGFRAEERFAWAVGGESYWFCCQPCIDDFVLAAKERPEEVRPADQYVR